jgi:hypothetical protein
MLVNQVRADAAEGYALAELVGGLAAVRPGDRLRSAGGRGDIRKDA